MSIAMSPCRYLFGKEPEEIFDIKKFTPPSINRYLETLMKVHQSLPIFLCDPCTFNHQCQLIGLLIGRIQKKYREQTEAEKCAFNDDNQFVHLAFFLSFNFLVDNSLYAKVIEKAGANAKIVLPAEKQFSLFCKDPGGCRTRAAREEFNVVFKKQIVSLITVQREISILHKELFTLLTTENLNIPCKNGNGMTQLYTPPKFAAVALMIDMMSKGSFPFVLKISVITEKGTGFLQFFRSGLEKTEKFPEKEDPVLVFECIATSGFSLSDCTTKAKKCPMYFFRHASQKDRHKENEPCIFCEPTAIDLTPYQKRIEIALQDPVQMFYALGADFTQEDPYQKAFHQFFTADHKKYEFLSKQFQSVIPLIKTLGLSRHAPITFTVDHVRIDSAEFALSKKTRTTMCAADFLKERGVL